MIKLLIINNSSKLSQNSGCTCIHLELPMVPLECNRSCGFEDFNLTLKNNLHI